ncbi:hypothetical protein DFS34DRAFT_277268, partial [Phlyctochytrium arcticum]
RDAAVAYIHQLGKAFDAPASLKYLLFDPNHSTSKSLAAQLKHKMCMDLDELGDATTMSDLTGITNNELSAAVCKYIPGIRKIMAIKDADALSSAHDLITSARILSYVEEGDGGDGGDRPSDEKLDKLLSSLINRRFKSGEVWDWDKELSELKDQAGVMRDYGIEPFFPLSIEALERASCMPPPMVITL